MSEKSLQNVQGRHSFSKIKSLPGKGIHSATVFKIPTRGCPNVVRHVVNVDEETPTRRDSKIKFAEVVVAATLYYISVPLYSQDSVSVILDDLTVYWQQSERGFLGSGVQLWGGGIFFHIRSSKKLTGTEGRVSLAKTLRRVHPYLVDAYRSPPLLKPAAPFKLQIWRSNAPLRQPG
ncbi:hypothetical protein CPB85DRAFT_1252347 [Mucidula mucida]|nr:hypothetical protein CPB85DRAFT_1252347 [Mucidula mucida]